MRPLHLFWCGGSLSFRWGVELVQLDSLAGVGNYFPMKSTNERETTSSRASDRQEN
jgi:hypothetical protein